jgi:hypothetical protein
MNTDKRKNLCLPYGISLCEPPLEDSIGADLCPIKRSAGFADCALLAQIMSYLYIYGRPHLFPKVDGPFTEVDSCAYINRCKLSVIS